MLDNMSPDQVRECVCCSTRRASTGGARRGLRWGHPRERRGLRCHGCRPDLHQRDHPVGARARPRARPATRRRSECCSRIDAGNTHTVIGLFDGGELADHWRIATAAERTSDELALMIQQFLGFHGFSFDGQVTGVAIASGVPSGHRRAARDDRALLRGSRRSCSSRASARACRSSTTTPRRSAPTGSRTRSRRTTSTAVRRSSSTSARRTRSRRSVKPASTSAARSSPASRSRWTRCSGARPRLRRVELVAPKNVIGKSTVESIQSGVGVRVLGPGRRAGRPVSSRARRVHGRGHRRPRRADHPALAHDPAQRALAHPDGLRIVFERNQYTRRSRDEPVAERARRLAKLDALRGAVASIRTPCASTAPHGRPSCAPQFGDLERRGRDRRRGRGRRPAPAASVAKAS